MNEREERAVRDYLSIREVILVAHARRQEVFDIVCASATKEEAERRLGTLLGISEGAPGALPIMDMDMSKWTQESRDFNASEVERLRQVLSDSPS